MLRTNLAAFSLKVKPGTYIQIRVDSRQMGVYDLFFARDGRRDFGGMSYLYSAQISFIISSWPKPVGTALEGVLAQYQFFSPTGLANVLLPGIWR